jgi:hypothetical protein
MARALQALTLAAALSVLASADAWTAPEQSPASISPSSSASASELLQEVTVTAKRAKLAPRVRKFVNQIAVEENGGNAGLARWGAPPVCPLVSGLPRPDGEFILERLSEIARVAGIPLAGEHCRPDLYILVTPQPVELLRGMEKRNRGFTFGYDPSFYPPLETPHPDLYFLCNTGPPGGSHLSFGTIWTFSRVFVIVDQRRLQSVTRGQLADYVAMVGFAKLRPNARLGDSPTILKLFDGAPQAAPTGMTDWDRTFLKSLYATEQKSKGQRGEIARAMVREIVH